jgi:hypothetical protein
MMWYSAGLLFEGIHEIQPALPSLWEESVVLINAETPDIAKTAAEEIGRQREHEYYVTDPKRHLLRWRFAQLEDVYEIPAQSFEHGTELFSRFLTQQDVDTLLTPFDEKRRRPI